MRLVARLSFDKLRDAGLFDKPRRGSHSAFWWLETTEGGVSPFATAFDALPAGGLTGFVRITFDP
jgi:hypothetical protein